MRQVLILQMEDEIKKFVIDISCFPHLRSSATEEKITIINKTLDSVLLAAGKLQGEINQQNILIKNTIGNEKPLYFCLYFILRF